jgi:hypothetical protein
VSTTNGGHVFDYNSIPHGGSCQRAKGAKISTHISGSDVPRPPAYYTNSVVYYLRGGAKAQQRFYSDRIQALDRIHHINVHPSDVTVAAQATFSKFGVVSMPNKDRYWMIDPYKTSLTEYIQSDVKVLSTETKHPKIEELFKDNIHAEGETSDDSVTHVLKPKKKVQFCLRIDSDSENETIGHVATDKDAEISEAMSESDPFEFSCRCGARGNGHILSNGENCVQCDACNNWSHVACQRGRVDEKRSFVCQDCGGFGLHPLPVGSKR